MTIQFADVLIDSLPIHLNKNVYTYLIPERLDIEPGDLVLIPFGQQKRTGYIVALHNNFPEANPRYILDIVSKQDLTEAYFQWLQWVTLYYGDQLHRVLSTAIPKGVSGRLKQIVKLALPSDDFLLFINELFPNSQKFKSLASYLTLDKYKTLDSIKKKFGKDILRELKFLKKRELISIEYKLEKSHEKEKKQLYATFLKQTQNLTTRQNEVLSILIQNGGHLPVTQLYQQAKTSGGLVKKLEAAGAISIEAHRIMRSPLSIKNSSPETIQLNAMQLEAFNKIRLIQEEIQTKQTPILLHGVTGSGKTEIYLKTIESVLEKNQSALILVPEIALTPMFIERFYQYFNEQVALWHSHLSEGERLDEWHRIKTGQAKVIIGARSAIFMPITNLGLIVMDEEHETSYKQDSSVRYDARTIAIQRAKMEKCLIIMGSATPRLESYYSATIKNDFHYISLPKRFANRSLPDVKIIDMRIENQSGNKGIFSRFLLQEMSQALQRKEQIILFLNRRGYASCVLCRSCGNAVQCPSCAVSLTFHKSEYILKCHYCFYTSQMPSSCPSCQHTAIRLFGLGTQKVETIVRQLFPEANILRMDKDTTTGKNAHFKILEQFSKHQADILIGTQMVAKGLDFHQVTVVGILAADQALNLPDFRASERTFQLLTQASGRAGRGELSSQIVIQTYAPDHPALQFASQHNYSGFFKGEIHIRQMLKYPPFTHLIKLSFCHENQKQAYQTAKQYSEDLIEYSFKQVILLGPSIAPIGKIQNLFRVNLLLKSPGLTQLIPGLRRLNRKYYSQVQRLIMDVDPYNML